MERRVCRARDEPHQTREARRLVPRFSYSLYSSCNVMPTVDLVIHVVKGNTMDKIHLVFDIGHYLIKPYKYRACRVCTSFPCRLPKTSKNKLLLCYLLLGGNYFFISTYLLTNSEQKISRNKILHFGGVLHTILLKVSTLWKNSMHILAKLQ